MPVAGLCAMAYLIKQRGKSHLVLMNGFQEFGKPDEILTDHGTQFVASRKDKKGFAKHKFGKFL